MPHAVTSPRPPFASRSGALTVHQVPAHQDNLIWLIVYDEAGHCAAVDGTGLDEVDTYCEAQGLTLTTILNTHTHWDHVGINKALAKAGRLGSLRVVGPAGAAADVPGLTEPVDEGDTLRLGAVTGRVMRTEGHIDGHVSYLFEDLLFCGDTLFAGGCGYLFDGPPAKMHDSLTRLAALDPDTKVCCAHEYTQDNLRFAWMLEPDNAALAERIREVWALRARGECAVPSTIAEERATNPFLRGAVPGLRQALTARMGLPEDADPVATFAATRALKDRKDHRALGDADLPLA
ncbi:MAG: hydroxyacylglutathione hydrolase [Alphaproteobacteria bacterium]|nr:hydroxyacylglutathione hydrolase [Alphaproteobacteria bacterium]